MKALIIGIGDAFTRLHFGSSAVIQAPRGLVLIDCPDPIHRALFEAHQKSGWPVEVNRIDDLIITHLHGDHCNGLESFGFYRRIGRMRIPSLTRPRLHVTQPVADRVWQKLAPAMDSAMGDRQPSRLQDYYDVHVLDPDATADVAGLQVRCRFTRHPVPTVGLTLNDGHKTLGWSSDTPFEKAHVDWLSAADLIVHESNLGLSHTPIESLNGLRPNIKGKMRLIHLPDDFDPAKTDIAILRQGQVLEI